MRTGYVRVLKKAAAVRTSEDVLPDISQTQRTNERPSASIGHKVGQSEPQIADWKDEAGLTPFNRIDVFGSRATLLHVAGDLNYLYTPGELARFPLVQHAIEGVRSRLENDVASKTQTGNPFLAQFDRQSRIYPLIDSLGAATDIGELRTLATVTEAERQEISTLKPEIRKELASFGASIARRIGPPKKAPSPTQNARTQSSSWSLTNSAFEKSMKRVVAYAPPADDLARIVDSISSFQSIWVA
jgi:hypothetical protein